MIYDSIPSAVMSVNILSYLGFNKTGLHDLWMNILSKIIEQFLNY